MSLKPIEMKIIEMSLPTGIINRRYVFGQDAQETRALRAAFSNLIKFNALKDVVVARRSDSGSGIHRCYLTPAGFKAYISQLPPGHILYGYNGPHTIRGNFNDEGKNRLVRESDVRTILASVGVLDVFATTIKGTTPFLTKRELWQAIDQITVRSNLADSLLLTVLNYADSRGLVGNLSSIAHPVLFDKRFALETLQKSIFSSGLVANFGTGEAYSVYKHLEFPPKPGWVKKQHTERLDASLLKAGINAEIEPYYKDCVRNAILLVDTWDQLEMFITKMPADFPEPYSHCFPIVVSATYPDQLQLLKTLLHSKLSDVINSTKNTILSTHPHLTPYVRSDRILNYRDNNNNFYSVATIIDLTLIRRKKTHLICYQDQYDYYHSLLPKATLLTIKRI